MKQLNLFKLFLFVAFLSAVSNLNAQIISYPPAFGPRTFAGSTTPTTSNWYKDFIGVRLEVTAPTPIVGSYTFTTANDGTTAAGNWGGVVTTPLVNVPIFEDAGVDSFGASPFSPADVDSIAAVPAGSPHKIMVIWRGPEPPGTAIDFGCKAQRAQAAGASACIIINEYAGQPPVGMGASTTCTGMTIPVFMVGNLDGIAISGQYRSSAPNTVTMTITPWGAGLTNDIGIIPDGGAFWHDYCVPSNQLSSNVAFNQLDGAFIANFGTSTATNVTLSGSLSFTPNGGTASLVHYDTVTFRATSPHLTYNSSFESDTAPGATYPFAPHDSIVAMFAPHEYSIVPTSGAAQGRYDLTYNVSSADVVDQDPADNTLTYSFYTTDSIYSKGRYDMVNDKPIEGLAESFGGSTDAEFIWGPTYFVGPTAGTAIESIQYFLAQNSTATPPTTVILSSTEGGNNVFIYKWVDGSNGTTPDSLIEDGELQLVSASFYTFDNLNDTSDALLQLRRLNTLTNYIGDSVGNVTTLFLDPNSWYYVAVDVPATTFLGVDDQLNPYPRAFGRAYTSNIMDYNSIVEADSNLSARPGQIDPAVPSSENDNVLTIDSFQLHSIKGAIPSVAMTVNNHPDTTGLSVKQTIKSSINLSVYPNPTSDYLNVSVSLQQPAKTVTYEIIDGLGRFVSKQTHYNVQNEVYTIPTNNLAPGNYHVAVVANGVLQVRPFTVLR